MFAAIKGVIRRWVGPPAVLIVGPGVVPDNDELAQRVFDRLQAVDDEDGPAIDDPLGFMLKIAADEVWSDIKMAAARERHTMLEIVHTLPARQRALLLDHLDHDMDVKQLARKHGLTRKIARRDLARAYAAVRMKLRYKDDERADTVDNAEPVRGATDSADAGDRAAAPVVGGTATVHNDRPADGGVPLPRLDQQPDEGSDQGGRPEHPAS